MISNETALAKDWNALKKSKRTEKSTWSNSLKTAIEESRREPLAKATYIFATLTMLCGLLLSAIAFISVLPESFNPLVTIAGEAILPISLLTVTLSVCSIATIKASTRKGCFCEDYDLSSLENRDLMKSFLLERGISAERQINCLIESCALAHDGAKRKLDRRREIASKSVIVPVTALATATFITPAVGFYIGNGAIDQFVKAVPAMLLASCSTIATTHQIMDEIIYKTTSNEQQIATFMQDLHRARIAGLDLENEKSAGNSEQDAPNRREPDRDQETDPHRNSAQRNPKTGELSHGDRSDRQIATSLPPSITLERSAATITPCAQRS